MSVFTLDPQFVVTGLAGGFAIGLTGMGGGAVLTPVLLALGVAPATAVGSDLVASLFIKPVAGFVHATARTVRWDLVRWLCVGSIPAALVGSVLSGRLTGTGESALKRAIGVTLLVAALAMLVRAIAADRSTRTGDGTPTASAQDRARPDPSVRPALTVSLGLLGGFLVGLTSVGSGSLMVVAMSVLYPRLSPKALVGTDIVQAVPLVAAAALAHVLMGNFALPLTGALLMGGLPGAWLGARVSSGRTTRFIRPFLVTLLVATGLKLVAT